MSKQPYILNQPAVRTTSVVFASPHSGRHYGWKFAKSSVLDERALRSSEDAFVDILFEDAPSLGAPLLCATYPRAYVDLNRSHEELDPILIEGVRRVHHNPRVNSGLGVIPRVVAGGRAIYRGKLTQKEAEARIAHAWHPYHQQLQKLLDENHDFFGEAVLVDLHSMPHEAIDSVSRAGAAGADVVLGDRFGAAAHHEIVDRIEAAFVSAGLTVARNAPFAGAYVTQHYGRPSRNQHAVQIEIDRTLYMNENLIRPNGNFKAFKRTLETVMQDIAAIGRPRHALAAE
ncbi:MAG: N-formylglutamate amidohydrolase [Pseudomonadota bacterium]